MDTINKVHLFLTKHNFSPDIADDLHKSIVLDMKKGLTTGGADQAMIKAGKATIRSIQEGENAIVIDAGGTNFRSCIVTKTKDGIEITDFQKTVMPATDRKLSKNQFYKAIADNILRLKDKSDKISFCFSYAMAITEDGDGKIIRFSKEINASAAVGTYLGKELHSELVHQGWTKTKKINVLNDTAALLLSTFTLQNNYSSRIAFILGTGMNSAFINDGKIIVTECGMFSGIPKSDFDLIIDGKTTHPNQSILEKMSSGAYLGELVFEMISTACIEKLLSKEFTESFWNIKLINTSDFDDIIKQTNENKTQTDNSEKPLYTIYKQSNNDDKKILKELIFNVIKRSANLSAEAIYAAILCAEKEKGELPVCITCNGSTFWKTPLLKETVETRLKKLISSSFEIIKIDDDITAGSFAAAFIDQLYAFNWE